jgi:parvulin-like peptidyl-prolyl isomerase
VRHSVKLLVTLMMLSLLMTACSGGSKSSDNPTPSDIQNDPTPVPAATLPVNSENIPLVAKVNGVEITEPQYQRALARRQMETGAADPSVLASIVLDNLIEQVLIDQAAVDLGVTVSDQQLDTEVQSFVTDAGGEENWQLWLNQNGYTGDEFRDALRGMMVTAQVQAAVVQNVGGTALHVHARHILVKTEAEAKDVLARLQAGEDFGALAKELSQDVTSADQGGDLGWFTENELLEPSLAQVAFSLLPGQIAGPVATRLGYHVIQTLGFEDRPIAPDKAANLAQIQFENWLQSMTEGATIERYIDQ